MIMLRKMCQSCFLVCLLFAIGGFVIVGCGAPPNSKLFTLDKTLRVGDELSCFSLGDIRNSESGIEWVAGDSMIYNQKIPPHISFKGRVDLRDGTRYICTNPDGCIVKLEGCIIIQGTVEVYKKEADHDVPKN